jgi:hypothetical protein
MMLDEKNFSDRLESLDMFLDVVEEAIDNWQSAAGL